MILSERERRTLLAALRCWLNELGFHSAAELQAAYADLGDAEPLTVAEIEALSLRLADLAAVVSELANSAQVLEAAADRIVNAVRRLQPQDRR